mgnify:CR=1 FL=1
MKMIFSVPVSPSFSADQYLAQDAPSDNPIMCEMMHDGKQMQGMMKKDKDGKMSCQMMDHSKMDHSKMDHGQSGHGKKKAAEAEKPQTEHKHD